MSGSWISRRSERLRITYHARCRTPATAERDVTIVNVTQEGCCIVLNEASMVTGSPILLRLESDEVLAGTVRWVRDGRAGILFDQYLEPRRLDYLRREHSTFLSEIDWDRETRRRSVI